MLGSYFVGSHILEFFGISIPVVQVGGGVVVMSMGWTLLTKKEEARNGTEPSANPDDMSRRAFYPLAMPLTVGPGSISVAVTLGANATHRYGVHIPIILSALAATALIGASVFVCYAFSDRLARLFGETGTTVFIRLSSFLLLCIGVQIFWNGLKALLSSLPPHLH